jgi:acetylornithine deacetylase/succinyl-diaminopimelate desuccinylase-like protein
LRSVSSSSSSNSGLFTDIDDVRTHGKDERLRQSSLFEGQEFLYRLVKRLAGG